VSWMRSRSTSASRRADQAAGRPLHLADARRAPWTRPTSSAQARENEGWRFVPGRAAYMDGRRGSCSMRLNFAGVGDEDIREGVRRMRQGRARAGRPVRTLTGSPPAQAQLEGRRTRMRTRNLARRLPARRAGQGRSPRWRRLAFPRRDQQGSVTPAPGSMSAAREVAC